MRDSKSPIITDWRKYAPYFNPAIDKRLACSHTNDLKLRSGFMDKVLELRIVCGFAFYVTSAYRSITHPVEARKSSPGAHTLGVAIDIHVTADQAWQVVAEAYKLGFTACGVSQKGAWNSRFIHLDSATAEDMLPRPSEKTDTPKTFYSY